VISDDLADDIFRALGVVGVAVQRADQRLGQRLHGQIDTALREAALAARWDGLPVWFHGDVQPGNLLLDYYGRLSAVIDFGTCGIGDRSCDTTIAWPPAGRSGRR
jgi:aminoglycoside phosphotransferase (APT) family kinase protein